jgi:hypothetical protein
MDYTNQLCMAHRCAHVQLKLRTKEQTTKQKTKKNEMKTNKQKWVLSLKVQKSSNTITG